MIVFGLAQCNKCDADGLERLQRRAAKIVSTSSSSDTAMQIIFKMGAARDSQRQTCL